MADYPDDADGEVLAELEALGLDMNAPLLIEFAVAAPGEVAADEICEAVSGKGYDAQIEYDDGEPLEGEELDPEEEEDFGPCWTVIVNVQMPPKYDEIIRIQAELDELARPFEGAIDGWGVMIESDNEDEEELA